MVFFWVFRNKLTSLHDLSNAFMNTRSYSFLRDTCKFLQLTSVFINCPLTLCINSDVFIESECGACFFMF